jgi:histidyl-tRNA synthetase
LIEDVGVFNRGIGEQSDVTRKEMYVFEDRSGRPLALRPEGTASVVRAFVQHHPTTPWKVWYLTPAFRYEQPQEGRYRQHHQLGVEAIGTDDPGVDVEVMALAWRFYGEIGLRDVLLQLNSMGDAACRPAYLELLANHLGAHESELCDEHARTWRENPLRVLDCKRSPCVDVTEKGPMLLDHLCEPCASHFLAVREGLSAIEIPYQLTPRLVRGFDYYTRTTFEFASTALSSAQNAVGGGGRYDGLVAELGGEPTGGIGFGSGVERLALALDAESVTEPGRRIDAFVIDTTGGAASLVLVEELRRVGLSVDRAYDRRSMKAQMKLADRSGARVALIIGPTEFQSGTVTMRDLRGADGDRQSQIHRGEVAAAVRRLCSGTD